MTHKNQTINFQQIFKSESPRVTGTLVRLFGDLSVAEDALQEAFAAALEKWPNEGVPKNPCSWLVSVGKFKTIDKIRKEVKGKEIIEQLKQSAQEPEDLIEPHIIDDDHLRLIFYCCHPTLPRDARIALALREACGLSTENIAKAYMIPIETLKKRISRAKNLIKEQNISYDIPDIGELAPRMNAVLHVIYLTFSNLFYVPSIFEIF